MAEEFGGRERLEALINAWLTEQSAKQRKRGGRPVRAGGIDRAAAEKMAADLAEHDAQIKGGRLLTGGGS